MEYNPNYPLRHLSIRVPWHDSGWNGTICKNTAKNSACLVLKNCAQNRNDEKEEGLSGKSIKDLQQEDYPVCVSERATFMAPFQFSKTIEHPYSKTSEEAHGQLKPTRVTFPPFSAPAIPYSWMLEKNVAYYADLYTLHYSQDREPKLSWKTGWVQEYHNQKALLNCFFGHFQPEKSLVFFYAKQVPFTEESGRVLVGVGRIKKIIPSEPYDGSNDKFSATYWEQIVLHSIRENAEDGFVLPYHEALQYQVKNPQYDIKELAVIVPDDRRDEFSYVSEHVSSDTAIRILLQCLKSVENAEKLGIGKNHNKIIQWIHNEIYKLEKLRGNYPGMGAALHAFGIDKGHFVAAAIVNAMKNDNENPWILFERALEDPKGILSKDVFDLIPANSKKLYLKLKKSNDQTRVDFLYLISRFEISIDQAKILFVEEEREKYVKERRDAEYLENPYLIYEDLRNTDESVALSSIDLGMYINNPTDNLLPKGLLYKDPFEYFRIRALVIKELEHGSQLGHTLLPRKHIIKTIRESVLKPACHVTKDYLELAEDSFKDSIVLENMKNGERAYQLSALSESRKIISKKVVERVGAKRLSMSTDWTSLLDKEFGQKNNEKPDEIEAKARQEKAAALKEIAEARFSILIGAAGTGKTTLLSILARHPEIENSGVLLLAPTGKARVRMEQIAGNIKVTAKTIAQFLSEYGRYNGKLTRYILSDQHCDGLYQTVILDEASMLTEEMLATTMDCLKGVKRFILVGDHRQLPPIGAGRPFVDIIKFLRPEGIESKFPRVDKSYAELTVKCR